MIILPVRVLGMTPIASIARIAPVASFAPCAPKPPAVAAVGGIPRIGHTGRRTLVSLHVDGQLAACPASRPPAPRTLLAPHPRAAPTVRIVILELAIPFAVALATTASASATAAATAAARTIAHRLGVVAIGEHATSALVGADRLLAVWRVRRRGAGDTTVVPRIMRHVLRLRLGLGLGLGLGVCLRLCLCLCLRLRRRASSGRGRWPAPERGHLVLLFLCGGRR